MTEHKKSVKVLSIFTVILAIFVCLIAILATVYDTFILPEITGGTVVEKTVMNATAKRPMDYRLRIEYSVDIGSITINGKDWCSVDKETYLAADVGMYYDKKTLDLTDADGNIVKKD